jgi:hypothetical protein
VLLPESYDDIEKFSGYILTLEAIAALMLVGVIFKNGSLFHFCVPPFLW